MEVFRGDFSVVGNSFEACLAHLDEVLKRCEETNLVLNWEKSHFVMKEGIVLGHNCSFLGHARFYRRFIKDFSKVAHPLFRLLEKDAKFHFDDACMRPFLELKEKLISAPIITAPDWTKLFELMCDASGVALGAVLGQRKEKIFHPIYYASKALNDAQANYTVTEQELLVVVFAFEKFQAYLLGTKVGTHRPCCA